MRRALAGIALLLAGALSARGDARLEELRGEIERLKSELAVLEREESGLLGEIARLDAGVRLHEAEAAEAGARLGEIEGALVERDGRLRELERAQGERRRYLAFRMRELYKSGPQGVLTSVLGGAGSVDAVRGLRYAVYLGERDARLLQAWRADQGRLGSERAALAVDRERFAAARRDASAAAAALGARRAERSAVLRRIRGDRIQHQSALGELEGASRELGRIVRESGAGAGRSALDVRKFRGLLDWPAAGRVATAFGTAIHPRFKTKVPHPGIDLEVPKGADFRTIFDGRVVYASNLRGYGLTAIVDHGGGVASVYTHASALIVSPGQDVARGEVLGKTGESGPLGGKGLYFEIRDGGRPVDPASWLRRR